MTMNGQLFFEMLVSAANALDNEQEVINNMNVFPVPDGDTGINMTLTLRTVNGLESYKGALSDCAKQAAEVALRAARGNSGAILSLFFRGMSKAFRGLDTADIGDVARAFRQGHTEAYKAVMNPTKGTILTVMQKCAESGEKFVEASAHEGAKKDMESLFETMLKASEVALAKTPEQLPKLKEAHVVDAGGYGFVTILKGMVAALKKNPVVLLNDHPAAAGAADFADFDTEEITFAYCTECIVEKSEAFAGEDTAGELHRFICEIGDSVVFVDDEAIIKLHVHTDHPGQVMEKALEYGMLATVKIENMKNQHSSLVDKQEKAESAPKVAKPTKKYGFVSVCLGEGIAAAFMDVGVDRIIHGGQTMNPSTQDIMDAVNLTPAEYVFVFPNNKNIYMVAEQAAGLIRDKKVIVVPTKSVPQGISAMIAFNPDISPEDNLEDMKAAIDSVTSMSVTNAVRSTTVEGEKIIGGQMLGLVNGSIDCVADSAEECLGKLAEQMKDASYVMVFLGEGMPEDAAADTEAIIRAKAPDCEVAVLMGGQPLYPYIISVE
ncbi:MAG: DAK2 domain-containing protein [Clostridia bacterium]|nr:DAK2 domain-containing protein [Clostridia bacterium]